ncbi:MAG: rluB [Cytophagaceae bacterium]|jgi:23S rRNA pseudouridine2605 synthase|nr:rluB [Cytophagaceae bacterium]
MKKQMDNKKKGSNSRSSSNTSRGKAGSGKSKPAFAFDKSSGKRGAGRSAGSKEDRPAGGSRGGAKAGGRSARPTGDLSRDEKKAISDSNFKKRSAGGFGDKKRNSSTAGFSKTDKPSTGPRTKRTSDSDSFDRGRSASSGRSERPSAGGARGGFKKDGPSDRNRSSAGSERSERSSGPRGGAGKSTFKKEGGSSERSSRSSAGTGRPERASSGPRGGAGRTGAFKKEEGSSERGSRSSAGSGASSGPRGGAGRTGGFKKEGGEGSFDKRKSSFGNKPERAPKSFGRGKKTDDAEEKTNPRFNEDEFFGRTSTRSVEDEINARKRQPKKAAVKKDEVKMTKRTEKSLLRRKVDKDFIDIKFSKEKEKTDSHHRELNVKKARSKDEPAAEDGIRLNRYLSNAGIASRREADQFIQEGLVKVNGKVVTELGTKVLPGDSVKYGNKIISPEKPVYVLLNKPKDFITTTDDPQERRTVMALVANACKERIVPVGRLDRNTTGLLLFTNDGDLSQKLTHPSSNIKKIYLVELDKPIAEKDFEMIKSGKLRLFDGPVKVDDLAVTDHTRKILGIEIHEGRNRIVRRIFEELGYTVEKLDRVAYAGLTKKDLSRGKWRFLSAQEINRLKYLE